MTSTAGQWDPAQYERFRAERRQPFEDLLQLLRPVPGGRLVDLGCGTGELTRDLHVHLGTAESVGVDTSVEMLERAEAFAGGGVRFEAGDLTTFEQPAQWDVVVASASLQWTSDHEAVLRRWRSSLRPGGQLAVQVPANPDHPSHRISSQLGEEEPYLSVLGPGGAADPVLSVLPPDRYAEVLDELGFVEQHVRLQVYGHHLPSTAAVVDWVKGTSLTRFKAKLPAELFEQFVAEYRRRLLAELGEREPYFYAFKRILFWGRLPA
jgi:trans-aconitate 2-methyltransferase